VRVGEVGFEETRKGSERVVGVVGPSACEDFDWRDGGDGWRCDVLSEPLLLLGWK
jgi:hypothetical protein